MGSSIQFHFLTFSSAKSNWNTCCKIAGSCLTLVSYKTIIRHCIVFCSQINFKPTHQYFKHIHKIIVDWLENWHNSKYIKSIEFQSHSTILTGCIEKNSHVSCWVIRNIETFYRVIFSFCNIIHVGSGACYGLLCLFKE